MLRLLLKMLLLPPDMLKSHAQGYVDLASEVGARYLCTLKNRWAMYALSVLTLLLALIFSGMALLLWGTLPLNDAPHPWVLPALPAACLCVSGLCWWWARNQRVQPLLKDIQAQIALDLQAVRQVHAA
jgi:heme/copper-type cytochrome/quinol oxidase subunit 3